MSVEAATILRWQPRAASGNRALFSNASAAEIRKPLSAQAGEPGLLPLAVFREKPAITGSNSFELMKGFTGPVYPLSSWSGDLHALVMEKNTTNPYVIHIDCEATVDGQVVLTQNQRLIFNPGSWISFSDVGHLRINSPADIMATSSQQRLFGTYNKTSVDFNEPGEVWVTWWTGRPGNGMMDDSDAIIAMAHAAASGSIVHPYGHHRVSKSIYFMKDDTTVDGVDPNFTWLDGYSGTDYLPNSDDLHADVTAWNLNRSSQRSFVVVEAPSDADVLTRVRLTNMTIRPPINNATSLIQPDGYSIYSRMKSVYVGYVREFEFDHCVLYGQAWEGLYHMWPNYNTAQDMPRRHWIHHNLFIGRESLDPRNPNATGALVNWNVGSRVYRDNPDQAVANVIIEHNIFETCPYGILQGGMGWNISNNVFRRPGECAIGYGEDTEGAGRGVISGNTIYQAGWGKTKGSCSALKAWGGEEGVTIVGNTIADTYYGRAITGHCPNTHFVGNTITGQRSGQTEGAVVFSPSDSPSGYDVWLSGNVVADSNTPGYAKWYGGLSTQADAGIANVRVFCANNVWDCNSYSINDGNPTYQGQIYLSGDRCSSRIYSHRDWATSTLNDSGQMDRVPLYWTNTKAYSQARANTLLVPDTITVADTGAGTPALLTLSPTTEYIKLNINDTSGCTVTLSKTAVQDGAQLLIFVMSDNTATINDVPGVQELAGGVTWRGERGDKIHFTYHEVVGGMKAWYEDWRVNN
jgi:hypothetical protein